MKRVFLVVGILTIFISACSSGDANKGEEGISSEVEISPSEVEFETTDAGNATSEYPEIKFERETIDLGSMVDGELKAFKFNFTNTGKSNLIIKSAKGSCGCTVPSPPKEPIAPGASSFINVEFNSAGRGPGPDAVEGIENVKNITVWTNCKESQKIISFRALILPKK